MKNNTLNIGKPLNIGKLLIKGLIYLAMFGLFIGFVLFLNKSAGEETEEEMTWKPEAVQGIPEGWELVCENQNLELYFEPSLVQFFVKEDRKSVV